MFGKAGVITPESGFRSGVPVCHSGRNLPQRLSAGRVRAEAPAQAQRSFAVTTEQENASTSSNRQVQQGPAQGKREVTTKASAQQNPIAAFWSEYQTRVGTDPVPTKALTSFCGFVLGDLLAQKIEGGSYDVLRCLRLGTYGLLLDGPVGHWWYTVLDKYVEPQDPKSTKAVLIKTAADQLIWAPVMTCVFFAVLKSLEGHPELIWPTIQDKLVKTVAANYVIWPAAHFINFRFVPTEHRILYNNCVSIVWTAYLSAISHDPCPPSFQSLADLWRYCICLIVWNAYLSTLSHTPTLDLEELGGLMDQTQSQFLDGLPSQASEAARSFAGATRDTFQKLPGIDQLLPRGQHYGIELSVPRKFELHPTRMVPATLISSLGSLLGVK